MSLSEKLLASAALRRQEIDIDGEKVTIREPNAFEYAHYQELLRADKTSAIAYLIHKCVLGEGDSPLLTEQQADEIASGSFRVSAVLATSIHRLIYGGNEAKNA